MALGLIFRSFMLAIAQLADPRFRRVFFIGIALALALLVGFTAAFAGFLDWITPEEIWLPILGEAAVPICLPYDSRRLRHHLDVSG